MSHPADASLNPSGTKIIGEVHRDGQGATPPVSHAEGVAEVDPKTGKPVEPVKDATEAPPAAKEPLKEEIPADPNAPTYTPEQITTAVEAAKAIDPRMVPYAEEFYKGGEKVSDATIKKAALEFGQPEAIVKAYFEGIKAQNALGRASQAAAAAPEQAALQAREAAIEAVIGGKDQAPKFVEWANANLTAAEQATWNKALTSADPDVASMVAQNFYARYTAAGNGPSPRDLTHNSSVTPASSGAVTGYASKSEMTKDMADARYSSDEAFRENVIARVAASNF